MRRRLAPALRCLLGLTLALTGGPAARAVPRPSLAAPQGSTQPVTPPPTPPSLPAMSPAARAELLDRINRERAVLGARPLALSTELDRVAQARAAETARRGAIPGPGDSNEIYRIERQIVAAGYRAQGWTESLTATAGDAGAVIAYWKQGDSFAAAMSRDYQDVGIGVASLQGVPLYEFLFAWPQREVFARQVAGLSDLGRVRTEMLEQVNAVRRARGLAPVAPDARLDAAAQRHAADMLARAYYDHLSPEGTAPRDRAAAEGFGADLIAENIAEGQFTVAEAMDGWMKSAGHRANILSPRVTALGAGLAVGRFEDRLRVLWVQELARPGF